MDLKERCLHYCEHISHITGTTCILLDMQAGAFIGDPFQHHCDVAQCDAYHTHLYGAYQAERWDGKYIYHCPRGLTFLATPVMIPGAAMEYCFITGPIIMVNFEDPLWYGDLTDLEGLEQVPRMTTIQTRSFGEMIHAMAGYIACSAPVPDVDSGYHAEMLHMMYDLSARVPEDKSYPMENERQLQKLIRTGDKEGSQKLLNELLGYIYFASGANFDRIKSRVHELLVIMSRATIEGGADADEIIFLSDNYVKEIQNFTSIEALSRWLSAVVHKYISCVFDFKDIKHRDIIYKVSQYVKAHLHEKLTLDEVAEHVYLSRSYLSRIIKEELGCTFTEYVNRLRIDRSKIYLMDAGRSLAEIAAAVGFEEQSYFNRVFKKATGVSPGKFREQRL